jgi:hypothetical protein
MLAVQCLVLYVTVVLSASSLSINSNSQMQAMLWAEALLSDKELLLLHELLLFC